LVSGEAVHSGRERGGRAAARYDDGDRETQGKGQGHSPINKSFGFEFVKVYTIEF
jgi:hypothetical protein